MYIGSLLTDTEIKKHCVEDEMIKPFFDSQITTEGDKPVISYGLSSFGYDVRVASEYKIFTNRKTIDPKNFLSDVCVNHTGDYCVIPPNGFVLARTIEHFKIPKDVLALAIGKSTYARCGLIVNVTPLEPDWFGWLTIELSNTTPAPLKIYSGEGICQILFLKSGVPDVTYARRAGKYQGQGQVVQTPKINSL